MTNHIVFPSFSIIIDVVVLVILLVDSVIERRSLFIHLMVASRSTTKINHPDILTSPVSKLCMKHILWGLIWTAHSPRVIRTYWITCEIGNKTEQLHWIFLKNWYNFYQFSVQSRVLSEMTKFWTNSRLFNEIQWLLMS